MPLDEKRILARIPVSAALSQAIEAKSKSNLRLRVLKDGGAHKLLQRLYADFISDTDFSKYPAFVMDMDKLFKKYGAKTGSADDLPSEDEDESADGKPEKKRKKKGRKSKK